MARPLAAIRRRWKAADPNATTWDTLQHQDAGSTMRTRDVHAHQDIRRGTRLAPKSARWGYIGSGVLAVVAAIAAWILWSVLAYIYLRVSAALSGLTNPLAPPSSDPGLGAMVAHVGVMKLWVCAGAGAGAGLITAQWVKGRVQTQNLKLEHSDINQHENDAHIQVPEEMQATHDWFPDVGAHSSVQPHAIISHMALTNKGLNPVRQTRFADKDIVDANGDIVFHAGEPLVDDYDRVLTATVPAIDEEFGTALVTSSLSAAGIHNGLALHRAYDPKKIPYNPGNANRDKLRGYDTVADLINGDWVLPDYEPQRPGGAYLVSTAPINTIVIAITRAGKGQTYIEPMIDIWSRELKPANMLVNDPKGELLRKFYVRLVVRGYWPLQFNLINPDKTDIYNPLGLSAENAREGNRIQCAAIIEGLAGVFFPPDAGDDPMWNNAANNAFKRAAYGLIDFYLEEERELRREAIATGMHPQVLANRLDDLWGKVSLYNCYQLFVQLSSKRIANPATKHRESWEKGEWSYPAEGEAYDPAKHRYRSEQEAVAAYQGASEVVGRRARFWDNKPELDALTLYFNATAALPSNSVRTEIGNTDNALRAMGDAEKMLASVYGIAITAMSFFTDPTIATLTSGKPSQNVDLAGFSFPRRIGVRFAPEYLDKHRLVGLQARWSCFADDRFTTGLEPAKAYSHEAMVSREGWARAMIAGVFPDDRAYLRLDLVNPQTQILVRTFHFRFTKSYQTSLSGRHLMTEQVTNQTLVKDGVLEELHVGPEATVVQRTTYPTQRVDPGVDAEAVRITTIDTPVITQESIHYVERPKAAFVVTPPHLQKYAKLILILIKQLVDVNFDQSYTAKPDQKPLYATRFMLDELGNLQSEGKGISNFETLLSIGLGQSQFFTIILQTIQQLLNVYGDDSDRILRGNAQPLTAKIATPTGWTTMGMVHPGMDVLTPAGTTTTITGVFPQGERDVYQVVRADGATTEACDQHLWDVVIIPPDDQPV